MPLKVKLGLGVQNAPLFFNYMENTVIEFGKHKGKTYGDVLKCDVSYCNWAMLKRGARSQAMMQFQEWLKSKAKKATCENCNGTGLTFII